jgi:hypothetical protein
MHEFGKCGVALLQCSETTRPAEVMRIDIDGPADVEERRSSSRIFFSPGFRWGFSCRAYCSRWLGGGVNPTALAAVH